MPNRLISDSRARSALRREHLFSKEGKERKGKMKGNR